jgi:DNA oxidative demethylase
MNLFFENSQVQPEGFSYIPEFLTREEEAKLLEIIFSLPLKPLIFQGFEAKRKIMSYGADYHFDTRKVTRGTPIPEAFSFLLEKVSRHLSIPVPEFAEMLLTEYPEGSVINWHRDGPPFEIIAGISLLSDCIFRFRPYDKAKQHRSNIIRHTVERRSLYLIKGEAREDWEHSILPVKETRYSITLRTLRAGQNK